MQRDAQKERLNAGMTSVQGMCGHEKVHLHDDGSVVVLSLRAQVLRVALQPLRLVSDGESTMVEIDEHTRGFLL